MIISIHFYYISLNSLRIGNVSEKVVEKITHFLC